MTQSTKGYVLFLAALGMMCSLLAPEIAALTTWASVYEPSFIAKVVGHLGAVIAAFVAGRLIPTNGGQ